MTDRSCRFSESKIVFHPFESKETIKSLDTILQLLTCCFGPYSRLNAFQNVNGGKVTLTSSLARTLKLISIARPEIRVLTSILNGYCNTYKEGGHFAGILSIQLIKSCLQLRKEIHPKLICDVLELLNVECSSYLKSEICKTKRKLDLTSISHFKNVINSILLTKPLVKSYADRLSTILLEAFIKTLDDSQNLIFATERGLLKDSRLLNGLYIRYHGCNKFEGSLDGKIVIFNESMSGDDFSQNFQTLKLIKTSDKDTNFPMLNKMLLFVAHLKEMDIKALFCQKVIHPFVKRRLIEKGIFFVERIGIEMTNSLSKLTGAKLISSFETSYLEEEDFGIGSISFEEINHKFYLTIKCTKSSIHTFLLITNDDDEEDEILTLLKNGDFCLRTLLQVPFVLCGGGCWLGDLHNFLNEKARSNFKEWSLKLNCKAQHLQIIANILSDNLKRMIYILHKTQKNYIDVRINDGHVFLDENKSCCCSNSTNTSGIVLDCLHIVENSLKCAINMCNLLISTNFFIEGQV
ncbi:DgyrCDS1288 [Dimorphilus gyrociliatus]|uniref:DgyrCDS1288 n=1 Tax=Dimorphilus gyrociliatus TaxID=2664684 RepID=A0A7I8V9Z3_9ANNE|nr:DgyrCDS1288 [Dimorphilus gyrociliatus]